MIEGSTENPVEIPPCPICGKKIVSLERRPDGNAKCEYEHTIPFSELYKKDSGSGAAQKPQGYNHERDHRVIASELEAELEPLKKRIAALEILLEQRGYEAREREKLVSEQQSTIDILRREIVDIKKNGSKTTRNFIKPK